MQTIEAELVQFTDLYTQKIGTKPGKVRHEAKVKTQARQSKRLAGGTKHKERPTTEASLCSLQEAIFKKSLTAGDLIAGHKVHQEKSLLGP